MNNNKKTWIKQTSDFMYQPIIKKLRRLENGADCVIVFVKLQALFAEFENSTINFNDYDESFASQLSDLIDEDIENIQSTLDLLIKQRIIISQNNNIFSWVDFQDSKIIKENSRTEYFREYRRHKRAYKKAQACEQSVNKCEQNVNSSQYVHNTFTACSQSQPSQPSDTRAKAKKETAQNEQVSTNNSRARVYIDINNNYNKDLNIKPKDKQDINNKNLRDKDLKTKDLNTKKLNNKNLKPKESLTVSKDSNNSNVDLQELTKQVIEHINCVTHKGYKALKQYRDLIQDRLNDGYTPQDFITAIDNKIANLASNPERNYWINQLINPKWILKPENLDNCLNLRNIPRAKKQDKAQSVYEQFDMLDKMFEGQPGLFDDILNEPKKDYFNRFDKEACA